ncbi:MAG: phosphotransferase [Micromonosporaceae bacterium]|nr:phosphotransferase [Micromonosporaceae bacterium]
MDSGLGSELASGLAEWLPRQRWFAAKGRDIAAVTEVVRRRLCQFEDSELEHAVIEVSYADEGGPERYQLFLGYRRQLPEKLEHVRIAELPGGRTAYDALWDDGLADSLLRFMATGAGFGDGALGFAAEPDAEIPHGDLVSSRVPDAEQSNTSVVYAEAAILKVFRRVTPGVNPDLELNRALHRAGNTHVAALLGRIEGLLDGKAVGYGMLTQFADNSADGWAMATASVRDLMAEQDLRADEVGGDFAAEAQRLGEAVATVHADLSRALGAGVLSSDGLVATAGQMRARLRAAIRVAPELEPYENALTEAYEELAALPTPAPIQRIHGDLHLGQVLRTPTTWLLIDFEGEPAKPLAERTGPDSPLRDVAGMLRSFDYAAGHLLLAEEREAPLAEELDAQLRYRTDEWVSRNRAAFCAGYAAAAGADPREQGVLLRAYELDKAVYETVYEARNRPHWLPVPLRSLDRLATGS